MKILHISTSDTDGAGIAALRLHQTLLKLNIDSNFICLYKTSLTPNITQFPKFYPRLYQRILANLGIPVTKSDKNISKLNAIKNKLTAELFTFPCSDYRIDKHPLCHKADIIIIHWAAGFLDFKSFFKNISPSKKIYWYTHDFNCILGGFHTLFDATRNNDADINTLENKIKNNKRSIFLQTKSLHIITNSEFSYRTILSSQIKEEKYILNIPIGIPENEFLKIDKNISKISLGYHPNDFIILTVSTKVNSPLKGLDRLLNVIKYNPITFKNIKIISIGKDTINELARYNYESLAEVWNPKFKSIILSAADVLISTSYEETFGQTIIEGYACGTPAIVYNNGALPELVSHDETGYIAQSDKEFSDFLQYLQIHREKCIEMGNNAFDTFKTKYTSEMQALKLMGCIDL